MATVLPQKPQKAGQFLTAQEMYGSTHEDLVNSAQLLMVSWHAPV